MSAGEYDPPYASTSYSSYTPRRPPSSASVYERPSSIPGRRESPSPSASHRYFPYERAPRSGSVYQSDHPNVYRPNALNVYRPDYDSYYGRTPSPERFISVRSAEPEIWDRPSPWSHATADTSSWQDERSRLPSPPLSYPIPRERERFCGRDDTMATRMFEPSDHWKQTHSSRVHRGDNMTSSFSGDYYPEYRNRSVREPSPERFSRFERPLGYYQAGGDRYRPGPSNWEPGPRTEYSSYRPQRESVSSWAPPYVPEPPLSPPRSYHRTPYTAVAPRISDHYEPSYNGRRLSRSRSATGSLSPRGRSHQSASAQKNNTNGSESRDRSFYPIRPIYDSDSGYLRRDDETDLSSRRKYSPRSSSRSSIDSTHPSESANQPPIAQYPHHIPPETSPAGSLEKEDYTKPLQDPCLTKPNYVIIGRADPLTKDFHNSPNLVPTTKTETISMQNIPQSSSKSFWPSNIPQNLNVNGETPAGKPKSSSERLSIELSRGLSVKSPSIRSPSPSADIAEYRELPVTDTGRATPPLKSTAVLKESSSCSLIDDLYSLPAHAPEREDLPAESSVPETAVEDRKAANEALRVAVMTRLLCDRQTVEERVEPILSANTALLSEDHGDSESTMEGLLTDVCSGKRLQRRLQSYRSAQPSLVNFFRRRQTAASEKVRHLREQYISLHHDWQAHCAALNARTRAIAAETELVHPTGRTTRRTANLGDAVRSDLEMEQIIASLGYDEATDPNHLCLRNIAAIPDMISVTRGKIDYLFDDTNNRVVNPDEYYAPSTGMHDWTESEKKIFIEKFAAYPKQFGIIADFLPNKSAAQCVAFYYLHKHRHIDFRRAVSQFAGNKRRRRGTGKKKGNALLADIAQHDAQVQRQSGYSRTGGSKRGRKGIPPPESKKPFGVRKSATQQLDGTPASTPTPEPDSKSKGRGKAPTTPASRTVSVSLDDNDDESLDFEPRPKKQKRTRKVKSAAIVSEELETIVASDYQDDPLAGRKPQTTATQWSEEDKKLFLTLLAQYGDDFKRIAASMPNKTTTQVSNYYSSNDAEQNLQAIAARAPKRSPSVDQSNSETIKSSSTLAVKPTNGLAQSSALNYAPQRPTLSQSSMPEILKSWGTITSRDPPPRTITQNQSRHYPSASYSQPLYPAIYAHYPGQYPPYDQRASNAPPSHLFDRSTENRQPATLAASSKSIPGSGGPHSYYHP